MILRRKLLFFFIYLALAILSVSAWHVVFGLPLVKVSPLQAFHDDIPVVIHYPKAISSLHEADSSGMAADFAFSQSLHEASAAMKDILQLGLFQDSLPLFIGIHNVGRNKNNFSAVINLQTQQLNPDAILQHPDIKRVIPSTFHRHQIYTAYRHDNSSFAIAHYRNLLIISSLPLLVEEAISSLSRKSSSLVRQSAFNNIIPGPDNQATRYVFVQIQYLPSLLNGTIINQVLPEIQRWASLIQWIRLDFNNNNISGTISSPRNATWPKAIQNQAISTNFYPIVPDNVALFFAAAIKNWNNFSSPKSSLFNKYIAPWSGRDAALALAPPRGVDIPLDWFVVLPIKRPQLANQRLNQLASHTGTLKDYRYNAFHIRQLLTPGFIPLLPQDWMPNPFFTIVNDFAIFASSQAALEVWLDAFVAGKTLDANEDFLSLNTASSHAGSWQFFLSSEKMNVQLKSSAPNEPRLTALSALFGNLIINGHQHQKGWQFKGAKQHQPNNPALSDIAWKTLLSAPAQTAPFPIVYPATQETCIAIQDQRDRFYLIGPSGDVRWSRILDGPIISDIRTLDNNANIIFNTANNIYIINMEGDDVGNFPLPLQSPATNGITVVNFDGNNQIGFFIACNNGNIYGFDRQGRPLPGWNPLPDIGIVNLPLTHFTKDYKDYFLALNDRNMLHIFARDGSLRFPPKTLDGDFLSKPEYQLSSSSNRIVAMNTAGKAHIIGLNNEHFNLLCPVGKNKQVKFELADVTKDDRKDYIVISDNYLNIFSYHSNNTFSRTLNYTASDPLDDVFAISMPDFPKNLIGTVSKQSGKIFLLNDEGQLLPGFPLAGHHPFFVADLYRNGQQLAVSAYGDSVYAFIIQ
jgi:hypothetical protein